MNDTLVLCYHAISVGWPAEGAVHPSRLNEQLELLVRRAYRGVTFQEAMSSPAGKVVAVTFDDAYASVLELAYPILSALGLPATVFVVTDFADGRPLAWPGVDHWLGTEYQAELRSLSWPQLRRLCDSGWEIGSHSNTHPRLTQCEDARLGSELRDSRSACELALGRPCRSFAYPYGDVDSRVAAATRDAGYEFAAALPPRLDGGSPLTFPRIGVYRGDSRRRYRLKVSPGIRRLRRLAGPAEAIMRQRVRGLGRRPTRQKGK